MYEQLAAVLAKVSNEKKATAQLLKILDHADEFATVKGRFASGGAGHSSIVADSVVKALLVARSQNQVAGAIAGLREIVEGTRSGRFILIVCGLTLSGRVRIAPNVEIVGLEELSSQIWNHNSQIVPLYQPFHAPQPSAAIVVDAPLSPSTCQTPRSPHPAFVDAACRADDVFVLLNLVCAVSTPMVSRWWEPINALPAVDTAHTTGPIDDTPAKTPDPTPFSDDAAEDMRTALESWKSIAEKDRKRFRIALRRLGLALRRQQAVDAAIELGIALETLFLPGINEELSYRICLRAAWTLGESAPSRKAVFAQTKMLYKLRSLAVHEGALPQQTGGVPTSKVLVEGCLMCRRAIQALLRNSIEFDQIVLG